MSSENSVGSSLMHQSGKIRVGTLASSYQITQSNTLTVNVLAFFTVVYNHVTGITELFIDKISRGSAAIPDIATHQLCLNNKSGHAGGSTGLDNDFRFYPYALDAAEISAVYDGTII